VTSKKSVSDYLTTVRLRELSSYCFVNISIVGGSGSTEEHYLNRNARSTDENSIAGYRRRRQWNWTGRYCERAEEQQRDSRTRLQ